MSSTFSGRATAAVLLSAVAAGVAVAYVLRSRQRKALERQTLPKKKQQDHAAEPVQHRAIRVPIPRSVEERTSFANFHEIESQHVAIDWKVDFNRRVLSGSVRITAKVKKDGLTQMVLDTSELTILSVQVDGQVVEYNFGPKHDAFGTSLKISLPVSSVGTLLTVEVIYETSPNASAMQWLSPEQTVGKVHPYLFTQCQSIHSRSMLPCQDAPCVKTTYEARVSVPSPLVALMSAVSTGSETSGSLTTFLFKQDIPVPSYLIAVAVGNLESRDIGPRSRVWSEPSVVDLGASEFVDTEMYIKAAEELCGEYVWGRYDLLMLPPSFPYGGMENPCLTFITPTLLAGDRSLSNVIAHEIAHSWSGNLVTNSTWSGFWINEGFTVFIERRILSKLFGENFAALKQRAGWANMLRSIERFGPSHDFTKLHIEMKDVDPDDCFSPVAYEKGSAFVSYLEKVVGGPKEFEPFLRAYVLRFQYGVVSAQDIKEFYNQYFLQRGVPQSTLDLVDWDKWLHSPGVPEYQPQMDQSLIESVNKVGEEWCTKGDVTQAVEGTWNADQKVVLLEYLIDAVEMGTTFSVETVEKIDKRYGFSNSRNSEILFKWCLFVLKTEYGKSKFDMVVRFVSDQGRMKFVRPVYRALLAAGEEGRKVAETTFHVNKDSYHAIARKMIQRDLDAGV